MAGDDEWLSVSEAAKRLGFYVDKVREFADDGYLVVKRPPTRRGHGHRRILATSVEELNAIMELPQLQRRAQLEALRRHNLGEEQ